VAAKSGDLLAAMPEAPCEATAAPRDQLIEILGDIAGRPVPTGSLHRLCSVSDLSAQVALAYFPWWVRQWFEGAEAGERHLMETNLRVALKIFHRLGYLRGMLTKLGQAAGSLPHLFPDETIATLERLHFDAPPMHYSLIREVLRDELGADPDRIFATFERQAFAAASLGQVHRARLKSGEAAAVKVQYPGIARTIEADFRNIGALLFPFRLTRGWDELKVIFEEVRRMLYQEVDYEREAEAARRARNLFRAEDGVVVPKVYPAYSTRRVLTTDFLAGQHLDAFLSANPPQDLRDAFGTKIYHAWVRLYYAFMGYGDSHSGNYIYWVCA
jgi:predicted unusual protein kinase regulating ubiquinone biosynthesis (AarF/ABC1/UbiB family)